MLTPHVDKVAQLLCEGKEPSINDLGNALAEAIKDRDFYQSTLSGMAGWMSRLVAAHLKKDDRAMANTFNEFIAKHVKVVHQTDGRKH